MEHSRNLTAKVKATLTKRTVDALQPEDKPRIAWDDKLTGCATPSSPWPSGS